MADTFTLYNRDFLEQTVEWYNRGISGYVLRPEYDIASNPSTGEYRVKKLRLDSNGGIVFTYTNETGYFPTIASTPSAGEQQVLGWRLNADKQVVVRHKALVADLSAITSNPARGEYRIKELRLDSNLNPVVTYDGTAVS